MKLVELSVRQPISIIVGILFTILAGLVAVRMVAVEMAPEVDDTIIAVTTFWENASPQEIESEVIDPQEEKLQSLSGLRSITSVSSQGQGQIRLEFNADIDKNIALRDVSDKLREVPSYPFGVDEPVIEASDPESQDYIAWFLLRSDDPEFDVRRLQTFSEDQLKPILERIPGMSEVNALGGVEREVQIEVDQEQLARFGITMSELRAKLLESNINASAGALPLGKLDIRLRSVGRFNSPESVKALVLRHDPAFGPVRVEHVAQVRESFKEPMSFVRASGERCIAFNFQREPGTNVLDIMDELKATVEGFNEPGAILENEAKRWGLQGRLEMKISYDATRYVRQALVQVQNNIYIGGALAVAVLLLFLRSLRSLGIIALSIPVSMIGAVVLMVALGRTVNVISLAGIAFAVGMVVDNSIVVLENIYRHLEMGKKRVQAAIEGSSEVAGAVLASSLTTLIVFVPILLITDQVGQLFRDISLSIMTAVGVSYIVAVTVIPAIAAKILNEKRYEKKSSGGNSNHRASGEDFYSPTTDESSAESSRSGWFESFLVAILGSSIAKILVISILATGSILGSMALMPPMDYLPKGNRNITFGLMLPPPGLHLDQLEEMGQRVEQSVRPYWEGQENRPPIPEPYTGRMVHPTDLSEYFLVSTGGILFHGGISTDDRHAVDNVALLQHAGRQEVLPGVYSFAFQFPLFRLGGSTGSAVKINLVGRDLDQVSGAAGALLGKLMQSYGPGATRPDPSNFNLKVQEVQLRMDEEALAKAGLRRSDLVLALQAAGDGIFLGEYEFKGDLVDLKMWSSQSREGGAVTRLEDTPLATADGQIMRLGQLAEVVWTEAAEKIKRVGRRRAVTLEFTAPPGAPLEQVVAELEATILELKQVGAIPPSVNTDIQGSAGKLTDIRNALLGDGSLMGLFSSSMFTSFVAIYLLMCILFQSWIKPLVIMFTVPLATFGGFLGLFLVHEWSMSDPYMPIQNLDVLTLLGFVILSGVVVNNAILIVAQADNLIKSTKLHPNEAIAKAAQSRVRPIFMSLLTSVGGMLPLILNPGSGSELYRGLGAVVVGGMLLSTLFTLILIPLLMSVMEAMRSFRSPVAQAGLASLVVGSLLGCQVPAQSHDSEVFEKVLERDPIVEQIGQVDGALSELSSDQEGASTSSWVKSLKNPTLERLIDLASQKELNLQILEQRLQEVLAIHGTHQQLNKPMIYGEASVRRQKLPAFQFPESSEWRAGFGFDWTLDWLGRIRDQAQMSQQALRQAQWDKEEHWKQLQVLITQQWSRYLYLEERGKQLQQLLESQQKLVAFSRHLNEMGRRGDDLILEAQFQEQQLEKQCRINGHERSRQQLMIEKTLGLNSGDLDGQLSSDRALKVSQPIRGVSTADLLRNRLDIRQAEAEVLKQAAALNLSRKEVYPKLSLNASLNSTAEQFSTWFSADSKGFSIGPQLSWRIFEFGNLKREKQAAAARYDASVLQWRQRVKTAILEVQEGLQLSEQAEDTLQKEDQLLSIRERAHARQLHLLRAGRSSDEECLLKQQALQSQTLQRLLAELKWKQSQLELVRRCSLP